MARPIILGVVGDSAAGKTTLTRGLVRVLGEENVTHVCVDDYHRYDRKQRAERNITPLHPDCNYMDIMAQHLAHMRAGEPFLKPVYRHDDGTFGPLGADRAEAVRGRRRPARLLHRGPAPPVRRARLPRAAGGAAPQVEGAARLLAPRLHDRPGARRARPARARLGGVHPAAAAARRHRRLVPAGHGDDQEHLDAELVLRSSLKHPDLRSVLERRARPEASSSPSATARRTCSSRARSTASSPSEIEETIWERLHFASHLRTERLGEFTIGTDLHRSESLALIQLLILYHLFTATASVALGGEGTRAETASPVA